MLLYFMASIQGQQPVLSRELGSLIVGPERVELLCGSMFLFLSLLREQGLVLPLRLNQGPYSRSDMVSGLAERPRSRNLDGYAGTLPTLH